MTAVSHGMPGERPLATSAFGARPCTFSGSEPASQRVPGVGPAYGGAAPFAVTPTPIVAAQSDNETSRRRYWTGDLIETSPR